MKNFEDFENQLLDTIIYGIMFYKSNSEKTDKNKITEVIGEDFYNDLLELKDEIKLDRTLFGHFDRCFVVNRQLIRYMT